MKQILKFLCVICLMMATALPAHATTLPAGYTELEYIESTGTQYIDTGIISYKNTDILKTKVRATDVINTQFITFQNPSSSARNIGLFITGSTVLYQHGSNPRISGAINANTDYTLKTSNGYLTINGSKTTGPLNSEFTVETHLLIGAANNNISGIQPDSRMFKGRIYYYKYEDKNSTVLFDGIPAKRNSDNSIGMYDTVSGQFFTNAGTGTFTAGPEIPSCNGTIVNYTTATGTVVQNGTPTPTNPIEPVFYKQGNMVLRKVGSAADSYDANTGKITRRVGVKTFSGGESLTMFSTNGYIKSDASNVAYILTGNDIGTGSKIVSNVFSYSDNAIWQYRGYPNTSKLNSNNQLHMNIANDVLGITDYTQETQGSVMTKAKAFFKRMYDAGTPVTVYYELQTPVEEDWTETSYCATGIKIATTKYTEDAFAGLMTTLSEAITKVTNIVDTTVQQATEIGVLAKTKQDRPDTDCPAGRKCLLIMGADNKPHWYLIQE